MCLPVFCWTNYHGEGWNFPSLDQTTWTKWLNRRGVEGKLIWFRTKLRTVKWINDPKAFAKSLTLGQTLLLQKAVDYLSKAPTGADATEDYQTTVPPKETSAEIPPAAPPANPVDLISPAPVLDTMLKQPEGLDAAALLSILSTNQPAAKTSPIDNGKGLTFDPFMFSDNKACNKLYDIRDYVTVMPDERREGSSIKVGEIELNLPETKPKLASITPVQYMEAALRILWEMATKDWRLLSTSVAVCWLPH